MVLLDELPTVFQKMLTEGEDSILQKILVEGEFSGGEYENSSSKFEYEDGLDEEKRFEDKLGSTDYEIVYENHKWEYAKEFLSEIPELAEDDEYSFMFKVSPSKGNNAAFANTLLYTVFNLQGKKKLNLACHVLDSKDGSNHFWLLKRK